jgi:hypothetical protein
MAGRFRIDTDAGFAAHGELSLAEGTTLETVQVGLSRMELRHTLTFHGRVVATFDTFDLYMVPEDAPKET